jgi:uncharacterized protein
VKSYKLSDYNYYFNYKNYNIIYNSLSGKLIKLDNPEFNTINSCLKDENSVLSLENDKLKNYLEDGLIIPDNEDEQYLINDLHKKFTNDDELFLIILPTEQCNLRCIYCYEKFQKGKMSLETQESILLYIRSVIGKYKNLYISWFGGEPLLAIDAIEHLSRAIIEICSKNNINYRAGITTNGTLLNENVLNTLTECSVRDFQITLDGGQSTHDKQRITQNKKGTFSIIYKNLLVMKNSTQKFLVILRTNIGVSTQPSIKSYIDKIYDDFGSDNRFKLHLVAIADLSGDVKSTIDLCDTYQLFQYYKYATKVGFKFDYYKSLYKPLKMICYAANPNSLVIGSDGNIYKCTVAFENELNQVGKINDNGTIDLNNEKLRLWVNNGFETSKKCSVCKLLPLCFGKFCPLEKISNKKEPCPPFDTHIKKYFELF